MPNIIELFGYRVFFWAQDGNEPIHVHISKGRPTIKATKIWLTETGGCIVANNNGRIPINELNKLIEALTTNYATIIDEWKAFFEIDEVKFYC